MRQPGLNRDLHSPRMGGELFLKVVLCLPNGPPCILRDGCIGGQSHRSACLDELHGQRGLIDDLDLFSFKQFKAVCFGHVKQPSLQQSRDESLFSFIEDARRLFLQDTSGSWL